MSGKSALIVVDLQNDFCEPDGSLAVKDSPAIVGIINNLKGSGKFDFCVLTCDWHPVDHCSFAANHPGQNAFTEIILEHSGTKQMLWPVHCLSHSVGAAFHPKMTRSASDIIVQKGMDKTVDSYSGFGSPPEDTGLDKILKEKGVKTVYCVGLAMDYCVGSTALDAARLGYETFVIEDAVRGVFPEGSQKMCAQLKEAGIRLVESSSVLSVTERKGCCRS